MADERITTRETSGTPGTHTTIIKDGSTRRSGGSGWFIGLILLVALIVGVYLFTQMSGSQTAKDNAIANAANEVGNAAGQVGAAAQQAGNAAQDAANNATNR